MVVELFSKIHAVQYAAGSFDQVVVTIRMKRKTGYFALTAIIPCLLIGGVEIATFLLPYSDPERLTLSFTCLLAYSMFQVTITSELPRSADNPPLLLLLISIFTFHIALAIFFQAICIHLAFQRSPGPGELFDKFSRILGILLRVQPGKAIIGEKNAGANAAWHYTAEVLNRAAFLIFVCLSVGTAVILLLLIPIANEVW